MLDTQALTIDPFIELGFVKVQSWLWTNKKYNLVIERYGDFSGTIFRGIKPYYLSYMNNAATLVNGQEIIAGSKEEVAKVARDIIEAHGKK
ncbi:hypothetical protein [Pontibacter ruber]|uniref:Uncharacterized protein n=1 Tax=Pontibacter ruber TaxID=1343895 RepID=A0ABW5CY51_9BACT|nr:hypothetical protein [Pontibacter ruber]